MAESSFATFPRVSLAARRRKIAKACNFCREHRVRCEATTPCPQCVANAVPCHRSRPSNTPQTKRQTRRDSGIINSSPAGHLAPTKPPNDSTVEVPAPSPSPTSNLAWTSHKTDSMLGFIARINAFCSGVSQLSPDTTPSGSNSSLEQMSPFPSSTLHDTPFAECDLSAAQISHLMKVFWSRLRPQMPIVELKDLEGSGQSARAPSPLQDAVTAYSLHHIYHSQLHTRLTGLNWPQFHQRKAMVGIPYFQRCLSAVTQFATFASPTISVMQCYCYLSLYLLDAGQHQAAYNMVGLALRITQSLNYMDARTGYSQCQLFRRIWWTLIHLDFRCSRHVGKPVNIHAENLMSLLPTREPRDISHPDGVLYHTETLRLTAAALVTNEAMDRHSFLPGGAEKTTDIEARSQCLSDHLFHLNKWREDLPPGRPFDSIHFDVPDIPVDPTASMNSFDAQDQLMEQSAMDTLLHTKLLLQYHNIIMSLHRVFIQFPSHPLVPKSNPKADAHAATALNHALTMIRILHDRSTIHEILHGVSELYQHQWNAVITIIGFMLAYPYCHRCPRAREYLHLALEVFNSAGSENTTAIRAASLTRHLCTKVDTLVQMLNLGQPTPETSSSSVPTGENQIAPNTVPESTWNIDHNDGASLPDLNNESLWSWADFINMDAWPSYCDEVGEAFMDPVDFLTPQS
ncbi:hypothetical protein N7532_000840 [Penicillium argentinense]|uniref:Zn(2)-C6 fungal-type domain-containing protein n=1 Tax=Penicillium argentinense TaxID=1131581 RepID=A0A9W9G655_9EURO|nr:uncharacterized protein N7532_000840 [Penicillium argentinense]KAJ5112795.1 hypothetical protein N7532_000840 [Penicillium argentinense]